MQDEYITSEQGRQALTPVDLHDGAPAGYWTKDEQGRVYHVWTADELPLRDRAPSGRVRPWRKHKVEGEALSEVYETLGTDPDRQQDAAGYLSKAKRLACCAQQAEFERLPSGELHLQQASFCRVRLCPMCQWRRSLKLGAQVRQVVERANADHIKDTGTAWRWLMVTFTVRNVPGPQLGATIDQLHKGLVSMTKCKRWQGAVRGWLRATEVTHCTDKRKAAYDTYHPHIHALLCVPASYFKGKGYIRQAEWAALWQHYAGVDYTPVVDVRTIKAEDGRKVSDLAPDEQAAAMGKAVAEVSKYASKPADYLVASDPDLTVRTVATLDRMLHHRRMTSWGGILKDIAQALALDDIESGDLVHIDDTASPDPVAEQAAQYVTYGWYVGAREYFVLGKRTGAAPAVERQQAAAARKTKRQHERQQGGIDFDRDMMLIELYMQARGAWDDKARKVAKYELQTLPRWQIVQRIKEYQASIDLPAGWEDKP